MNGPLVEFGDILAYANDRVLAKYMAESGTSASDAQACFLALKQFLLSAHLAGGGSVPSVEVDRLWHAFLLHTRDYSEFCARYIGAFMHHEPHFDDTADAKNLRAFAGSLFALDERFWPVHFAGDCSSGCDCCA